MVRLSTIQCCFLFVVVCNVIFRCPSNATEDERQVYIVYLGGLPKGYYSTYHGKMLKEQHIDMLQQVVDDSFVRRALVRSYKRSFNGFVACLTKKEQEKLARFDEVVSIFPSRTLWPRTTRSWDYMGLRENINSNFGSDIIIGVIDSGIWPESNSFSDKGFGPIPKKWKGACKGGRNFTCNRKLIGARHYPSSLNILRRESVRDTVGHGTHAASIAAGNSVKDASFYGLAQGTARGGLPSARIAVYKVCSSGGCKEEDILTAFDDAIADGVDIITISLGSQKLVDMKDDGISIGSLHAMEKGILTVHSAGNNGFRPRTVESVAPWLLTVGASSMDRGIVTKVSLGNGQKVVGKAVNSFKMNGTKFPLVYGKDVTKTCSESDARLCAAGCLDKSLVKGKIVLCDQKAGIREALSVGAVGAIAKSGQSPDISNVVPLPASTLLPSDLNIVKNYYINSTKDAKAIISTSEIVKNTDAPVVASFSGKGPNPIISDILKPDITAPGVEILAAYPPKAPVSNDPSDKRSVQYKIMSGTSMACPHVAGAAAYVKSVHPDWSPSAIKSALMTTAWPMDPKKHPIAEFSYGSGHLNPVKATNPGLVYETNKEDYVKMLCTLGYSTETIQKLFKDKSVSCSKLKVASKDLNYPSMTSEVERGAPLSASFSRTVTNVGFAKSTYTAKITKPADCNIIVEPTTLSFKQLNEKKSFVVTVKCNQQRPMISATLVWSDGTHTVRSPIVVY